jgi:uncharacterized protein (UPF0261 family)
MADTSKKTILLIATLDTKAAEARFLKESVESQGCAVMVMNPGILAAPPYKPDVDIVELAAAAGEVLKVLLASKRQGALHRRMMAGCAVLTRKLYDEGKSRAWSASAAIRVPTSAPTAMRALPFGVPKFMVSTVATGRAKFGEYTKTPRTSSIMHSVADIAGLNRVNPERLVEGRRLHRRHGQERRSLGGQPPGQNPRGHVHARHHYPGAPCAPSPPGIQGYEVVRLPS